jgi:geranylgeranyl pyrophosphate synthase
MFAHDYKLGIALGKRVRPALALAASELFGGKEEHAMPVAVASEVCIISLLLCSFYKD